MYISKKEKKSKWKLFLFFVFAILIFNLVYLEKNVQKFENISHGYADIISDYNIVLKDNADIINSLNTALNEKNQKIKEYEETFKKEKIARLKVHVTVYNPVPEQTDDTPDITAYGKKGKPGITFAASDDLIKKLNLKPGVKMYIPGIPSKSKDGMWVFGDKMHPRWKNRVDLMIKSKKQISRKYIVYIFI